MLKHICSLLKATVHTHLCTYLLICISSPRISGLDDFVHVNHDTNIKA